MRKNQNARYLAYSSRRCAVLRQCELNSDSRCVSWFYFYGVHHSIIQLGLVWRKLAITCGSLFVLGRWAMIASFIYWPVMTPYLWRRPIWSKAVRAFPGNFLATRLENNYERRSSTCGRKTWVLEGLVWCELSTRNATRNYAQVQTLDGNCYREIKEQTQMLLAQCVFRALFEFREVGKFLPFFCWHFRAIFLLFVNDIAWWSYRVTVMTGSCVALETQWTENFLRASQNHLTLARVFFLVVVVVESHHCHFWVWWWWYVWIFICGY
jgi:hypothetical protein